MTNLTQKQKENFMQRAAELSKFGSDNNFGGPFGAVIVKDGKIIGEGFNSVVKLNDPTAHAEILAIREACKNLNTFDLSGAVIFTSCEPCPMCLSAIYWANIEEIYFANTKKDAAKAGFRDDFIYEEFKLPPEKRHKECCRIDSQAAKEVMQDWNTKQDRVKY